MRTNAELEADLETLPEKLGDAKESWRIKTLNRERAEALLYARLKGEDKKRTVDDIKSLVRADDGRYAAVLEEIKAEAAYERMHEKLMATKHISGIRRAF